MQTRRLGCTDLELSVIGLGTWAIGGDGWAFAWGAQDDADSVRSIHEALAHGINWIDTAAIYGNGHSEVVVGQALKEWDSEVVIATKCGRLANGAGRPLACIKRDSIMKECEASLQRLGVDVIDLYQMHWPQPDEDVEEAFEAMLALKRQGKIRWAGVSNFSATQLDRVLALGEVASLQPPYSLINRSAESDGLAWCREHQCGAIVYSPMQCGLLTGKVTKAWVEALPDDDWRKTKNPFFQEPQLSKHLALVEALKEMAAQSEHTVGQLAVAWTLARPEVTAAIVGARQPGQISGITPAGDWQLNDDAMAFIDELVVIADRDF